ncbi:MAG: PaaI family thioesterase [Clostridia bacterium]|nr:PaaI family thioesterase [Clostridia bacterium]
MLNLDIEKLKAKIEKGKEDPRTIIGQIDLKFLDADLENDTVRYSFDAADWMRNPYGDIHGGVIATAIDTAMGTTSVTLENNYVTTADFTIHFLRPALGDRYIIQITYGLIGKRTMRMEGKFIDAETGKLVATSIAGFMKTV